MQNFIHIKFYTFILGIHEKCKFYCIISGITLQYDIVK